MTSFDTSSFRRFVRGQLFHVLVGGRIALGGSSKLAAAGLLAAFSLAPGLPAACGMPDGVTLAQAFLGISYPNAMHVSGAIWQAQQNGDLPMPDRERLTATGSELAELIWREHLAAIDGLVLLGVNFDALARRDHAISLVLVDGMHWARFAPGPAADIMGSTFDCNVETVPQGDLVVVTNDVVLHAIGRGDISFLEAKELGVVRIYGSDPQAAAFISDFGEMGTEPLSPPPRQVSLRQRVKALTGGQATRGVLARLEQK